MYAKPSYQLGPNIAVGADVSGSYIHFYEKGQNDGEGFLVGPFIDWSITQNTRAYAEAGFQSLTFNGGGTIGDNSDSNSWYARLQVTNQLTDYLTQHLIFSKNAELGFGQNYYTPCIMSNTARTGGSPLRCRSRRPPSSSTTRPPGLGSEEAERYGFALAARYVLTPSITLGVDYRYLLKQSNLEGLDYQQDLVLLSMFYSF